MKTLIVVVLAVLFLICVLLDKARRTLGVKELRRRARGSKDKATSNIYKLVAHGDSLKLFLWLVGGVSGAVLFIKIANASVYTAVFLMLLASWLVLSDRPLNTKGFLWKLTGAISLPTNKIVDFLHPVLVSVAKLANRHRTTQTPSRIYDKEDLLEFIKAQMHQAENRIDQSDLELAGAALTFGGKTVASVMTPRRKIKFVAATDSIGPLLMDELHTSGFNYFPVLQTKSKETNPKIIGTLNLKDLLDHSGKGHVRDVVKREVCTISETQTLRDALDTCLKTGQQLLIVSNNFQEIAGVISLQDVINQILGTQKEQSGHQEPKVVE